MCLDVITRGRRLAVAALALAGAAAAFARGAEPLHSECIFPPEQWHNHGSCIVECPNGDLLVCWFHGSGERKSDDVEILGARWEARTGRWSAPFPLADTPGFPDTNCCMLVDRHDTLWLLWPTIQANLWESALMKIKWSRDFMTPGQPPRWDMLDVMHVKHGGDFAATVKHKLDAYLGDAPLDDRVQRWVADVEKQAADKLTSRLGWFTRARPLELPDGRILVGLYSDGFSFSLVGITDDGGKTWTYSEPIVGGANIQPSFATRADGTIVAYMRDNGPAPKRVMVSESRDRGETWSIVVDHPTLPNPGAGLEVMTLRDGDWLCIYNDLEEGRHSLAVSLSSDEGATWPVTRHLERVPAGEGSFHYPSVIEDARGILHATYSAFVPTPDGERKTIKYARFDKDWIRQGDSAPAVVFADKRFLPEIEAAACDEQGNVYCVGYEDLRTVARITPDGRAEAFVRLPEGRTGNGIRFGRDGTMFIADYTGHAVLRVDPRTREVSIFAHEPRMNQPNDLALAPDGTLYASDPDWQAGTGQVWRIDRDGSTHLVAADMGTTNGIDVSPDGRRLYVNESVQRNIWVFDIEPDGSLANRRLFLSFDDHGFDGMRFAADGTLYCTRYGKGTVVAISPEGTVIDEIDVLGPQPTNLAFGGPGRRTVYVTEAGKRRIVSFRAPRPGRE